MPIDLRTTRLDMLALVNPAIRQPIERLITKLSMYTFNLHSPSYDYRGYFEVFETWRSPLRQAALAPGATQAKPWESAHQYGLAVDFAVKTIHEDPAQTGQWAWPTDAPYDDFKRIVEEEPALVVPIKWDRLHVQWRYWPEMQAWFSNHRPGVNGFVPPEPANDNPKTGRPGRR